MIGNIDNLLNILTDLFQKKEVQSIMKEVAEVTGYLWDRGWAERNAGNFSINITEVFTNKELDKLSSYPFYPLKKEYSGIARSLFIISGAGTRMRQVAKNPTGNICFIYINSAGTAYHIIGGEKGEPAIKPSSELATHLAIHQVLHQKKATEKVVLHAHVTELIALTHLPGFDNEDQLNTILLGMHPEALTYIPQGVGFIPYFLPGTEKIAQKTLGVLENHKTIIWEKHGCLAVSKTLAEAFDDLDLLAKMARIYFLCKSTGSEPSRLTANQTGEIRNSTPTVPRD
ncbi:MAG: rhamnulose-1-phosphate aldolase [Bacteroidales bacterium]|jgi:rhamnulose-1-phosphate aldolase|nr:rhamnulose-1-phosphate aldolase [Bacteroidales bacterium]